MPNSVNYVKFQRGTIAAYNALKTRGLIDSNTLYFIYESADKKNGYLYLGDKLISGSGSGTNITKLSDISDVLETVTDVGAFLVKNDSGKWESKSLADVASLIASQLEINVNANTFEFKTVAGANPELNLIGFNVAESGSYLKKGAAGKLEWEKPAEDFNTISTKIVDLQNQVNNFSTVIKNEIANANHLSYKPVGSLEDITSAENNKENVVYLVPNGSGNDNNSYDEYMLINSKPERLGTFGSVDLTEYAKVSQLQAVEKKLVEEYTPLGLFNSTVGSLDNLGAAYVAGDTTNIVNEINKVYESIIWGELSE